MNQCLNKCIRDSTQEGGSVVVIKPTLIIALSEHLSIVEKKAMVQLLHTRRSSI